MSSAQFWDEANDEASVRLVSLVGALGELLLYSILNLIVSAVGLIHVRCLDTSYTPEAL
jgi:hypothetical protein